MRRGPPERPRVSFVVTVYNKAPYVAEVFASLRDQLPDGEAEFIFVDDGSADASVAVLERMREDLAPLLRGSVRILSTGSNGGPSKATNVGCRAATGGYIHLVDGDDRLPKGASAAMLRLAAAHDADIVYGLHRVMTKKRLAVPDDPPFEVSAAPLPFMIGRRLVGVRFLARRETVLRSGGANESLLIMDCVLPWRIAAVAQRIALLKAPVIERRVAAIGRMSENADQEHHDYVASAVDVLDGHAAAAGAAGRILRLRCLGRLSGYALRRGKPHLWALFVAASLLEATGFGGRLSRTAMLRGLEMIANQGRVRRVVGPTAPLLDDASPEVGMPPPALAPDERDGR